MAGHASGQAALHATARDGLPVLTAAGFWDAWKNPETSQVLLSCAMIIMEPNALVSGEAGVGMLKPAPKDSVDTLAGVEAREPLKGAGG